jgi:hypothetical protein
LSYVGGLGREERVYLLDIFSGVLFRFLPELSGDVA